MVPLQHLVPAEFKIISLKTKCAITFIKIKQICIYWNINYRLYLMYCLCNLNDTDVLCYYVAIHLHSSRAS